MKNFSLLLFFAGIICQAYSQDNNYDLPAEFKDIAVQAFQKISPDAKLWYADAAKQHPAGRFDSVWTRRKLKKNSEWLL
ncbi:MAG: hypothetical protein ABJA79_09425 [Parafilimonas sp.]